MSLYGLLGTAPPRVTYCILHQASSPKGGEDYVATIRQMHDAVRQESAILTAALEKGKREAIARESQVLRGSLTEFLSTPMRSDNASVLNIFTEAFERFERVVAGLAPVGVTGSSDGRVVPLPAPKPPGRRLIASGKTYLRDLGFAGGASKADVFESVFEMAGGFNLDVLEHIIRDRLGIYSGAHGQHLLRAGTYAFAAYNCVGNWGGDGTPSPYEAALLFAKPVMEYAPFREAVAEAAGQMVNDLKFPGATLWQRKLGLGRGKEFVLRCACASADHAMKIGHWLQQRAEPAFLRAALLDGGSLLVKEFLDI